MASDFTLQNMEDGFPEAFLRGLRSTFLSDMEYLNIKEGGSRGGSDKGKEDFEDLRLTLQETDYGNFLANEVRHIGRRCNRPRPVACRRRDSPSSACSLR